MAKGSINYLREVKKICKESKGNCKECKLGYQKRLKNTLCPRLTDPRTWSDSKTTDMVKGV